MAHTLTAKLGSQIPYFSRWRKLVPPKRLSELGNRIQSRFVCVFCGGVKAETGRAFNLCLSDGPDAKGLYYPCTELEALINRRIEKDNELIQRHGELRLSGQFCYECNGFGCWWCLVNQRR